MATQLTFVSWNLHGIPFIEDPEVRFARIAEYVRELRPAPELLLFQEVWGGSLADQLREHLAEYEAPAGLERNWIGQRPTGLMAFARRAGPWKIDEVDFHEFDLHAPWWRVWEGDGLARKGVQQLRLGNGRDELTVLHTHLQATYGKPEYEPIVADQLQQMTSLAQELGNSRPIIAAGDLNTRASRSGYQELRKRWIDLTADFRASCDCGTSVRDDGQPGAWIDYVLAYDLPRFRVEADLNLLTNHKRDDPYSDHNGLFVVLRIGGAHTAAWLLGAALALGGAEARLARRELLRGAGAALVGALAPRL